MVGRHNNSPFLLLIFVLFSGANLNFEDVLPHGDGKSPNDWVVGPRTPEWPFPLLINVGDPKHLQVLG